MTTIELDRADLIIAFKVHRGVLTNEQIIQGNFVDALDELLRDDSIPRLSADWDDESHWHLTVFGMRVSDTYRTTVTV